MEVRQGAVLQDSVWLRSVFRPLLVVVLVMCLAIGFVAVAQVITPGWGRGLALPFLLLVSVESVYTTLWLASPERRGYRTARFRLGEALTLLLLARIAALGIIGRWPDGSLFHQWLQDPLSFLDGTFLFLSFLTLVCWSECALMMGILERMSLKPDELVAKPWLARAMDWNEVRARHPSRADLLQEFTAHWLWGGLILAICAGLSRVELLPASGQLIGIRHLGLSPLLQVALVAYFLGGLLMVSQGRLAVLRARWQYEGTPVEPAVVRRWGRLGLGMLIAIGLLAAMLPFGSSFALAQVLMAIIAFLMQLAYLMMLLFLSLFSSLLGLLGMRMGELVGTVKPEPPPTPELLRGGVQLPEWLGGLLVWLIMAAIIAYSLTAYLSGRGLRLDRGRLRRLWAWLLSWLGLWRGRLTTATRRMRALIPSRHAAESGQEASPWHFFSLKRLSPREQIQYFYLSTVRRATARGVPRRPSETPREYEGDLEANWPELEQELVSLTDSFIYARYSRRELGVEDARHAQQVWKRIKASLRGRAAPSRPADPSKKRPV
ncbi:MAG: DUF4129 domain-containing protein [Anaerolineae bacterium]|nr:DUF4129 domain-containing protein [Anaerolineae bacterium]MDW8098214.1 DUF4129 domain-containing protein [Anaerolineae bacterium]